MAFSQLAATDHDEAGQFLINDTDDEMPNNIAGREHSRQCLLNSDEELEDAREGHWDGQNRQRRRTSMLALISAVAVLALIVAVVHGTQTYSRPTDEASDKYSVVNNAQPDWQVITQERDLCSAVTENCLSTKCCKTTAYKCFMKTEGKAECMKSCAVGRDSPTCSLMQEEVQFQEGDADTMFCFSVYTHNTGSSTPNHELKLLEMQHAEEKSIFECNGYAVYSDVKADLGGGLSTIQVHDVENDFHFEKRKETGAWVNTGMFKQVWKHVGEAGGYKKYAWTVKVDPDAVFLPRRLVQRIRDFPRPEGGIFLVNCKHVDNGFFGNLEVFSAMAFSVLVDNIDKCNTELPWKIGVKHGEYGPMGEDLFAEKCMEKNGVAKAEAFDITIDGACPADRPMNLAHDKHWRANCHDVASAAAIHPFKAPYDYFRCLSATERAEHTVR